MQNGIIRRVQCSFCGSLVDDKHPICYNCFEKVEEFEKRINKKFIAATVYTVFCLLMYIYLVFIYLDLTDK